MAGECTVSTLTKGNSPQAPPSKQGPPCRKLCTARLGSALFPPQQRATHLRHRLQNKAPHVVNRVLHGWGVHTALVRPEEALQQRLPAQCKSNASTRLVGSANKTLKKFVHACGD